MAATKTEKPILFSTKMVRAILDGRKTQTRRIIKPQADNYTGDALGLPFIYPVSKNTVHRDQPILCPYGEPGTELWVRETFGVEKRKEKRIVYKAGPTVRPVEKWKPSIHMPRSASRIRLTVEDIRAERVREISEGDAVAEGIDRLFTQEEIEKTAGLDGSPEAHGWKNYLWHGLDDVTQKQADNWDHQYSGYESAVGSFSSLWDSINAKPKPVKVDGEIHHYESFPWEDIQETREHRGKPWHVFGNPYVWAVEFEVKNIKGA